MTPSAKSADKYTEGMEVLVTTVQELSLARDLDAVMHIVRSAARRLTGADGASFILRDGDKCFYADEDAIEPLWKGHRFPMETCVSGWAMIHKEAAVIPDIYNDERVPVEAYRPTFVKSMVMVPIRRIDPIAAIGNYWADQRTPSDDQVKLLQSLADITAVTMENINIYNELENRVTERTAELKAAIKDLEAFSYSVSHDLKAPLRTVRGFMDLLMENHGEEMSDGAKAITRKVIHSATNMYQIIDDLLVFFTMGSKELRRELINMDEMVSAICASCLENEPGRKIDFLITDLHPSYVDPTMMHHVWANLIQNAVKYSRAKENAIIEIGSEIVDDTVVYHVKDNGAGFDMQYYSQLFEVFKRLHTDREFEGTGIGLAMVDRVITKHGGRIWAEAETGKGANFYFSLPKSVA